MRLADGDGLDRLGLRPLVCCGPDEWCFRGKSLNHSTQKAAKVFGVFWVPLGWPPVERITTHRTRLQHGPAWPIERLRKALLT